MKIYILIGHTPVPTSDLLEWGRWMESRERVVKQESIGDMNISTVFLGLDHSFSENGPPLLFESMIFDGPLDETQDRCATWEQAEEMHENMCKRARAVKPKSKLKIEIVNVPLVKNQKDELTS